MPLLPDRLSPGAWRLDRRSCFRGFHQQLLQSCHRCASVTLEHCTPVSPRVLSTREVAWLFPTAVSTPISIICDPRCGCGARTSCLSAASSFATCCLLQASSACNSLFCLVVSRHKLLLHRSDGFFRRRLPEVSGTRCFPNDSTRPVRRPSLLRDLDTSISAVNFCGP